MSLTIRLSFSVVEFCVVDVAVNTRSVITEVYIRSMWLKIAPPCEI